MENSSVIYEITAHVNADLIEQYEDYMQNRHIPDLLATGYFNGAKFTRAASGYYRVQYEADNAQSLAQYLKNEAEHLRADFAAHFPSGITVARENWTVLKSWRNDAES